MELVPQKARSCGTQLVWEAEAQRLATELRPGQLLGREPGLSLATRQDVGGVAFVVLSAPWTAIESQPLPVAETDGLLLFE